MKKIKNIVTIVAIASMSLFAVGCNMVQKTPEAIQKTVVAKVGDEKITMADINTELEPQINQLKEQYGEDYLNSDEVKKQLADAKKSVLNNLVTEKIFLKKEILMFLYPDVVVSIRLIGKHLLKKIHLFERITVR